MEIAKITKTKMKLPFPTVASIGNYPNPFNPTTNIGFELPVSGFVSINVYDILGREVRTLVNELKEKGKYNIVFDAKEYIDRCIFLQIKS